MKCGVTVKKVEPEDLDSLADLMRQEAEKGDWSFSADNPRHHDNVAHMTVQLSMNPEDEDMGWIAYKDGEPAGFITMPDKNLPGGVFVSETARNSGVAKSLVLAREEYLRDELGWTEVERPIEAGNYPSISLHVNSLGYEFTQASRETLRDPDLTEDTVIYVRKDLV